VTGLPSLTPGFESLLLDASIACLHCLFVQASAQALEEADVDGLAGRGRRRPGSRRLRFSCEAAASRLAFSSPAYFAAPHLCRPAFSRRRRPGRRRTAVRSSPGVTLGFLLRGPICRRAAIPPPRSAVACFRWCQPRSMTALLVPLPAPMAARSARGSSPAPVPARHPGGAACRGNRHTRRPWPLSAVEPAPRRVLVRAQCLRKLRLRAWLSRPPPSSPAHRSAPHSAVA
jgi:hypothetical protein